MGVSLIRLGNCRVWSEGCGASTRGGLSDPLFLRCNCPAARRVCLSEGSLFEHRPSSPIADSQH
eukprot:scaffold39117_cov148-Skeletonema_marinoi.AAC.1